MNGFGIFTWAVIIYIIKYRTVKNMQATTKMIKNMVMENSICLVLIYELIIQMEKFIKDSGQMENKIILMMNK